AFFRAIKNALLCDRCEITRLPAWKLQVRTREDLRHALNESFVVLAVPGFIEVELVVEIIFFKEWQDRHPPTQKRLAAFVANRLSWKLVFRVMVIQQRERLLLEIVHRHVSSTRFGSGLHGGKQTRTQDSHHRRRRELLLRRTGSLDMEERKLCAI